MEKTNSWELKTNKLEGGYVLRKGTFLSVVQYFGKKIGLKDKMLFIKKKLGACLGSVKMR